jgi:hypothetical protein
VKNHDTIIIVSEFSVELEKNEKTSGIKMKPGNPITIPQRKVPTSFSFFAMEGYINI